MHCWITAALLPGCSDTESLATVTEVMLEEQYMVIPANSTVGDVRAPKTPLANLLAPTGITTTDNAVAKANFWHTAIMESVNKCNSDHYLAVSQTGFKTSA